MKKIYVAGCGGMLGEAFHKQFKEEYELKCTDKDLDDTYVTNTLAVENAVLISNKLDIPLLYIRWLQGAVRRLGHAQPAWRLRPLQVYGRALCRRACKQIPRVPRWVDDGSRT